eukprot:PhM_4_TR18624/c2_g1_i1/m.27232
MSLLLLFVDCCLPLPPFSAQDGVETNVSLIDRTMETLMWISALAKPAEIVPTRLVLATLKTTSRTIDGVGLPSASVSDIGLDSFAWSSSADSTATPSMGPNETESCTDSFPASAASTCRQFTFRFVRFCWALTVSAASAAASLVGRGALAGTVAVVVAACCVVGDGQTTGSSSIRVLCEYLTTMESHVTSTSVLAAPRTTLQPNLETRKGSGTTRERQEDATATSSTRMQMLPGDCMPSPMSSLGNTMLTLANGSALTSPVGGRTIASMPSTPPLRRSEKVLPLGSLAADAFDFLPTCVYTMAGASTASMSPGWLSSMPNSPSSFPHTAADAAIRSETDRTNVKMKGTMSSVSSRE